MIICKPKLILDIQSMTVFIEMLTIHFGFTQCACISVDFINPTYPYLPVSPPPTPSLFLSFIFLSLKDTQLCFRRWLYCTSKYDLLILNAIQGHVWWRKTQGLCIISVPAAPFTFTSTVTCFVLLLISQHARAFCDTMATVL